MLFFNLCDLIKDLELVSFIQENAFHFLFSTQCNHLCISAGKYCEGAGLAEPTGDCSAGWYCSSGAYSSKPTPFVNTSDSYSVNTVCPIYSLNDTGAICTPGMIY